MRTLRRDELFAKMTKPRTTLELASHLGRPPSSVHHLLQQLRREGLAEKAGTYDDHTLWVLTERASSAPPKRDPRTEVRGDAADLLQLIRARPGICAAEAATELRRNQAGVGAVAHRLESKGLIRAEYSGRMRRLFAVDAIGGGR